MKRVLLALFVIAAGAEAVYMAVSRPKAAPAYLTAPIERGRISSTVTATGTVKAVVTVEVGSELSGQIDKLYVDFNDEVEQGQPIARLDQRTFQAKVGEAKAALEAAKTRVQIQKAAIERARSNLAASRAKGGILEAREARAQAVLDAAKRDFARTRQLQHKGAASKRGLDRARTDQDLAAADLREAKAAIAVHAQEVATADADLQQAEAELLNAEATVTQKEAELNQAEVQLERTVIRSPIDGVVIGRDVDRGQTVAASLKAPTLFKIAQDLRRMEIHAKIDEADIGRIHVGQRVSFRVDAFPKHRFPGRVTQIRKEADVVKNVVTYTVIISTRNDNLILLPGMTALVRIVVDEFDKVLKLPNAALRYRPADAEGGSAAASHINLPAESQSANTEVWIVGEHGEPVPVHVKTGLRNASMTAILNGPLREGQEVIVGTAPARNDRRLFGLRFGF